MHRFHTAEHIAAVISVAFAVWGMACVSDRAAGGERSPEPKQTSTGDEPPSERADGSSQDAESNAPDRPEPHDASIVVEAGHFEWAPEELPVVFHTLAESRATRPAWEAARSAAFAREQSAFPVWVPYYHDNSLVDRTIREFGRGLADPKEGETVYFGIAGPFADRYVHLFECGPGLAGEDGAFDGAPMWHMGEFVVSCNWPNLRYFVLRSAEGIAVEPDGVKWEEPRSSGDNFNEYEVGHLGIPKTAPRFARWWRGLAKWGLEYYKDYYQGKDTSERASGNFLFAATSESGPGLRSRRVEEQSKKVARRHGIWTDRIFEFIHVTLRHRITIGIPRSNLLKIGEDDD